MSWFRQSPSAKPDFTGLQLQTSTNTLPVPIVWGQTKIAANVIWYANFRTHGGGGGKGGAFASGAASYSYSADLILALCEGPIVSVASIWKEQSICTLASLGLTLFNGATPQAVWGYAASAYPAEALSYAGLAYVCAASYALGSSADIGNHNFEVVGVLAGTGVNGVDADPALVIADFLTNPQYGAGFPAACLNATTLYGSGGDSSLQTYCRAMGLAFSPALVTQQQGSAILNRWLQLLNTAAVWSGGELLFVPYADTAIPSGPITKTVQAVVPGAGNAQATITPSVTVCAASLFLADLGVVYAATGAALSYGGAGAPSAAGVYGLSTAGIYLFSAADAGQSVTIRFSSSVPVAFVPAVTPIYNLTDADFLDSGGGKDPLQATRADPFSLPTIQRINCLSRSNQYGATPVEARDQSQIELLGARVGPAIEANEICDDVVVGPLVAQTILQRQLYVRARFSFRLSWEYCLLDPMDVVTINDANLGLASYPVRIVSIEEDERGLLSIEAEELTAGVSSPAYYPSSGPRGFALDHGLTASPVNPPLIYEPPAGLTGNTAQLWLGASGGNGGGTDPNWGGAYVWVSLDGVSYTQMATISQSLRQGFLTAALPAASGWDPTRVLSANVAESGGALSGGSLAAAQQGVTLCLIDAELVAYQSATLTAAYQYNLTGLQRGLYASPPAAHAAGAAFARLDAAVVKYDIPAAYVGRTLYLKFQSFNIFGGGLQSLAACVAYPHTPTGAGVIGPVASSLAAGASLDYGTTSAAVSEADDFGDLTSPYVTTIDLGTLTT